jgi:membrane protease YdiL (CAAX protease family)
MKINKEMTKKAKLINNWANLNVQTQSSDPAVIRFWQRMPVVIRATISGFFVSTIGIVAWLVIMNLIPVPWSILLMIGVFWLYWKYFSGSWWPESTAEARSNSFRPVKLPTVVWKWSLVAAALFVIVSQSAVVLTFRIIVFPTELFTLYNFDSIPLWLAWVVIVMLALEAGIFEEIGYRGYMQVPLEKRYGPGVGITVVSIMFTIVHLHQVWAPPILFHIFALGVLLGILAYASGSLIPSIIGHVVMDIFSFSYWWSDVAGRYEMQTVFETGIDHHFIVWSLILGASIVLFFWTTRKIITVRQQM